MKLEPVAFSESAKVVFPATAGGAVFFGIPLSDAVLYASLTLIALQGFFLLRKEVYQPWKTRSMVLQPSPAH